ncbi:alpha/beta hydrolase [Lignipirellula cremea]|uniref:Alpha/beta hydrolase family protein n=1 Tax=Lignipirellula cremea TaxID=2528010 RepID=A0A518DM65_9BACT|nr:alpha/beta hydrolase [Lignipirellula cremea]QDU92929.1 Alpha/beta hydrolase family protein [Lignipirellula cremea]
MVGRLLVFGRRFLAAYLVVLLVLLALENSLIFPGPRYPEGYWNGLPPGVEDVYFSSADKVRLHGWYREHPQARGVALYAHGNGENVSNLGEVLELLHERDQLTVLVFDYRGYGRSEGSPNGPGVIADGRAAHQWLAEKAGVAPAEIIVMGRSLGGAIACDLAALHQSKGLIVERSFTSMPDTAAWHYPWLPVRWVMRTQLDSRSRIEEYRGPLLQTHGDADQVVPYFLGEQLFAACPSKDKNFITDARTGHNDAYSSTYLQAQADFLRRITTPSKEPPTTKN